MAWDVAQAIAAGVSEALPAAQVISLPLGDGGEGTSGAIGRAVPGSRMIEVTVRDPVGRPVAAQFALLPDRRAVVEMAAASGLGLLAPGERDVMRADTRGTGQLILAALDLLHSPPAEHCGSGGPDAPMLPTPPTLVLGVGGSASVDGGLGMLAALGASLADRNGRPLAEWGGRALEQVAEVNLDRLDPRLAKTKIILASDVTNPLLGPEGAAAVFGPQKGASPEQVLRLDHGLARWSKMLAEQTGHTIEGFAGSGAAGGVGGVAVGVLEAAFRPGIELALELVGFDRQAAGSDLIITGEGRFDRQTLHGKAAMGVARAAARLGVPVCVLAGGIGDADAEAGLPGQAIVLSIADRPQSLEQSHARATELLRAAGRRAAGLWAFGYDAGRRQRGC